MWKLPKMWKKMQLLEKKYAIFFKKNVILLQYKMQFLKNMVFRKTCHANVIL